MLLMALFALFITMASNINQQNIIMIDLFVLSVIKTAYTTQFNTFYFAFIVMMHKPILDKDNVVYVLIYSIHILSLIREK